MKTKFLIFCYTSFGNSILKITLIYNLRKVYPDSQIDIICDRDSITTELLRKTTFVNEIIYFDIKENLSLFLVFRSSINRRYYDFIFLPFDSTPSWFWLLAPTFNRSKLVAHYNLMVHNKFRLIREYAKLILVRCNWVPVLKGRHEVDLNLDLIEAISLTPFTRERTPSIIIKRKQTEKKLPKKYLALQISARNGKQTPKTWKPQNFINLINLWREKHPLFEFILVGNLGDREYFEKSFNGFRKNFVHNLLGETDLDELIFILRNASAIVVHDSGLMHLSNLLNIPLIALYGPTDFTRTAPLGINSKVLFSKKKECWAAMYGFRIDEDDLNKTHEPYECMEGISPHDIIDKLEEIIIDIHPR